MGLAVLATCDGCGVTHTTAAKSGDEVARPFLWQPAVAVTGLWCKGCIDAVRDAEWRARQAVLAARRAEVASA